jgi:DNA replication protein DnaC
MIKLDEIPIRRSSWVRIANIPKARIGWEFSDCVDVTEDDMSACKGWVRAVREGRVIRAEGFKSCGKGLLLVGKPGQGKTALALTIIQEIIRTLPLDAFGVTEGKSLVKPCYFTTFSDIVALKGSLINEHSDEAERLFLGLHGNCKDDAYNIRVLVIDDVGKEHTSASGWQSTLLHDILRARFNNGLPTIVTTNLPVKAWEAEYGEATGSFIHEAFATIELQSSKGDLRK